MLRFHRIYFGLMAILFLVEVAIALFVHDRIVRPYVGDLLVVMLIYCFVRSFLAISVWRAAIGVLLFAYTIEILQYFNLVELLGLQNYRLANIVIGNSFAWVDLVAYTVGIAIVVWVERMRKGKQCSAQ